MESQVTNMLRDLKFRLQGQAGNGKDISNAPERHHLTGSNGEVTEESLSSACQHVVLHKDQLQEMVDGAMDALLKDDSVALLEKISAISEFTCRHKKKYLTQICLEKTREMLKESAAWPMQMFEDFNDFAQLVGADDQTLADVVSKFFKQQQASRVSTPTQTGKKTKIFAFVGKSKHLKAAISQLLPAQ
jgi:hypothetical protein